MNLLGEVRGVLSRYKVRPKRRFSQNFLVEDEILDKMISYASISRSDSVLEIGAGLGFLTERLAEAAGQVIAVEIDPRLTQILAHRLRNYKNIVIVRGDILKIREMPPFNKVVSVPPYSISSRLLFWLLRRRFDCAVLTFQEEFGRRLAASPNTKSYGRLTVAVYYHADVDLLDLIPKEFFWPTPEVNSVIVRLRPRRPPFFVENEESFFNFVRLVFTQRNKKLRNAAATFFSSIGIPKSTYIQLIDSIPFHYMRVKEMSPEDLALVFNDLVRRLHDMNYQVQSP